MGWTPEQQQAIEKNGSNILVAAAAGSGKTAVLVERIIQKIINEKIDIDKLLVVTFTNAAAVEMRERILDAIYKKIDENPNDENLKRQLLLLPKANISTIHSFCLDVIKNNFFEIDLSSNFRIASEEEIALLKQELLDDLFEEYYEQENENFLELIDIYAGYNNDNNLKDIIFKIHNFISSFPYPKRWLHEQIELFNEKNDYDNDFGKTIWGNILLKEFSDKIENNINSLKIIYNKLKKFFELEKATQIIKRDIEVLENLKSKTLISWDDTFEESNRFKLEKWSDDKKVSSNLKDEAKNIRAIVRKKIKKAIEDIMLYDSEEAYKDVFLVYDILVKLEKVINAFDDEYSKRKKDKNIVDFGDIEHYALKILVKEEDGEFVPTDVAKRYQDRFVEIAIDEYQDSNRVQEEILSKVSKGNNIYMVGDVKQSIYKFRQACPDLFLEKYDKYSLEGNSNGLKIQLFKNFRSRENVLAVTNEIFENIMSKELGEIDYNQNEYLNYMANYQDYENALGKTEIDIIDLKEAENNDNISNEDVSNDDIVTEDVSDDDTEDLEISEELERYLEKEEIEARFVAKRIKELMDSNFEVQDKKLGIRKLKYKDIVILLRSPGRIGSIYEKELLALGIPVYSDASNEYLDTIEIQTITNVLKVLDNPIDDIPFVSTLRGFLGGFSDNELVEIRLADRNSSFYEAFQKYIIDNKGKLREKAIEFISKIEHWKSLSEYLSISELIWQIYLETGYYNYVGLMVNGNIRQSNLKMLLERAKSYEQTSFKGLYNFIKFIDKMKIEKNDFSSAKVIGENEDVVRIMSIHKSKGLEFPVVFLSSTSKWINLKDLNDTILLHQKIGLGPDYINYERRIKYSTAAKCAIKLKVKEDTISEEMRVLYVALTRAREKLIITGISNDYKKLIEKMKENLSVYDEESSKINPLLIKNSNSYLEWILLVWLKSTKFSNIVDMQIINQNEKINVVENEQKEKLEKIDFSKYNNFKNLEEIFSWTYPNIESTKLPIKCSVSSIKELTLEKNDNIEVGIANVKPQFLEENKKLTSSQKGTLVHLILQKIDLKKSYTFDELKEFVNNLVEKNVLTSFEMENINISKIYNFLNSELAENIKKAKYIYKEQQFCTKIKAKSIFEIVSEDEILVQGIIDLYYIDEENRIILVDYKTDYVEENHENELIEKYNIQLKLYKEALEKALNKSVYKTFIYSIYLGKALEL